MFLELQYQNRWKVLMQDQQSNPIQASISSLLNQMAKIL